MATDVRLVDGFGTENRVKISADGFLYVQPNTDPPVVQDTFMTVYREFMKNSAGSSDMTTSTLGSEYVINAEEDVDIFITTLSFLIAAPGITLRGWGGTGGTGGATTPLTNGLTLFYQDVNGIINIGTQLRTNYDVVRLCLGQPATGGAADAFIVNSVSGGNAGIIPYLSFGNFGYQFGVKLRAGSTDKMVLRFNDTMVGENLGTMNVIAYGFRRKLTTNG